MTPPAAEQPTRARFITLGFLCTMSFILYLDRVCMAQAVKPIREEFNLTREEMSYALMAFTLGYGLFQVPIGGWGDRFGVHRVLTGIVVFWSAFTALTAACGWFTALTAACSALVQLVVVRFLFGVSEAGAYPNAARVFAKWFPPGERGRVQGLMLACGLVGGSFSPLLVALMIKYRGWRSPFLLFGIVGIVWAAAFYWWFRDDPAKHPRVNEAERSLIGGSGPPTPRSRLPWGEVVRNRTIGLLASIIVCTAFVSYVYFSWYSDYLQSARGVEQVRSGQLTSLVLAGGALGTIAGGFVVDFLTRRVANPNRARRLVCSAAMATSAGLLALAIYVDSPLLSSVFSCLALFMAMSFQSTWWSTAIEVGGPHTGAIFGLMNGIGAFGAMGSQYFFGKYTDWRKAHGYIGRDQWDPAFWVCVAALLVATVLWLGVDPRRRIGQRDEIKA